MYMYVYIYIYKINLIHKTAVQKFGISKIF